MTSVIERLDIDLLSSPRLTFDDDDRIVVVSDFHMGVGDYADDFRRNEPIALEALRHYYRHGFFLILAGDMEELWENRSPHPIITTHFAIYRILRDFHHARRLYKLYGNHDEMWRKQAMVRRHLWYTSAARARGHEPLLKGLVVYAGVLLVHRPSGHSLFVTHGNQGDPYWMYAPSRFFLRYFWRPLQRYGLHDPTSPAQNHRRRVILEERIAHWVKLRHQPVLGGHTHHPLFPSEDDLPYYNDGSGVHPYSVTAMEITDGAMSLVKWSNSSTSRDGIIHREVMAGPRPFPRV